MKRHNGTNFRPCDSWKKNKQQCCKLEPFLDGLREPAPPWADLPLPDPESISVPVSYEVSLAGSFDIYTVRQSSVRKHNFSVTFSLKNYELFAFFCSLISVRVETARKYAVSYFRKMYFTFMGNCVNLRLFACPKKTFFPKVRENSNWMYIFACEGALIVFVIAAYIIFLNYRQFTVRKNHS